MKPLPDITAINRAYFEGCAAGELRIRLCHACDARFRFAHGWCPECWSADIGWVAASGRGTVSHLTIIHQAPYPAFEADVPYVLALIDLDEGVRMMANVVNCDPEDVRIGMAVIVCFERRGEISLPQFRPTPDGPAAHRG
jgi:uncharacterized OB-fold protein